MTCTTLTPLILLSTFEVPGGHVDILANYPKTEGIETK